MIADLTNGGLPLFFLLLAAGSMFDVACALAAVKLDAATDDEASERCKFGKSSSVCCEYCSLVKADGTCVAALTGGYKWNSLVETKSVLFRSLDHGTISLSSRTFKNSVSVS